MRAEEFITENAGTTTSGSIAPVSQPVGGVIKRAQNTKPAKYANSFDNTGKKKHAGR